APCPIPSIDPDKGVTVGCTDWELQKNGTMGRQITVDETYHTIAFVWTFMDRSSSPVGRTTKYEAYYPDFGAFGGGAGGIFVGPVPLGPEWAGFATIAHDTAGLNFVAFHWSQDTSSLPIRPYVLKDLVRGLGAFAGWGGDFGIGRLPESLWTPYSLDPADEWIWPQIAHTPTGEINHLVIRNNHYNRGDFLYTRQVAKVWQPAFVFGTGGLISPTVVASRTSQRVALCWTGGRGDGTANNCSISREHYPSWGHLDNDLYYMLSNDGGATWGACQNVTMRPDSLPGGFAPAAHVTALFDAADNLHLVWSAMQWDGLSGGRNFSGKLFHWDEASGLTRTAVGGVWTPPNCTGGGFELNVSQPQLSECDGKLYLTFVQFAPVFLGRGDDCANWAVTQQNGAANGDIYVTVS
ncbi:MAG TPA: hypothetical protein VLB27_01620, partial [candidate division Zixibacteria bacterium]|nr:hypothetical protein [candidate division Zixibacteria bacterium]